MRSLCTVVVTGILSAWSPAHTVVDPAAVDIKTFQFAPDTVRVKVGEKVVFTNRDDIEHTVTAGSPDKRGTSFNKTLNGKGTSVEVVFDRPGTFAYFCDRHQFMHGAVTVTR